MTGTQVKTPGTGKKVIKVILRILAIILTFVIVLAAALVLMIKMILGSTSEKAKEILTTTLLETGQLKFVVSLFLSPEEIQEIVDRNKMQPIDDTVNTDLINIGGKGTETGDDTPTDEKDIEVFTVPGRTFTGYMIKVKDPSRVSLATIYPWRAEGVTLDVLVEDNKAIGGINGGIYNSYNNSGGAPFGVVVSNGEIQMNNPQGDRGYVLVGLTNDNILEIFNIDMYTPAQMEKVIKEKGIRDAVTFQEESSDANNHFVQLVINGKERELNGAGSGLNPRTAIGQCADGSILMLVTDGRGKEGHLGASASDLIDIMVDYGAVNAANLDGGSSSCMYYDHEWLMTSVTFYYSNASWKLPFAFIVK
ncbi:MAG: phosphodiester glycosidase family protein [Clostridia bacterium]|nr:phosphodiester glycosidase family protein [Clostridia bacterium]